MQQNEKRNIRTLSREELENYFLQIGEKKFRAKQVYDWLWKQPVQHFSEMTNIAKSLQEKLSDEFSFPSLNIAQKNISTDGTTKFLFQTFDKLFVEGVLIPTESRKTACISSQIGCNVGCKFCATGLIKQKRNLFFDEIFDQVALINKMSEEENEKKLTNIVFMGMGEPLLNYINVLKSIEKITSEDGLAMSPKRITVSTSGIVNQILRLAKDKVKFNLALSLHAPTDEVRNKIMPINKTNNLKSLTDALNVFYKETKNQISFEYVLLKNINDSIEDAEELFKLYKRIPVSVINIIEFNPVPKLHFSSPDITTTEKFIEYLTRKKVNVRIRKSRGKDIAAACGQLAGRQ